MMRNILSIYLTLLSLGSFAGNDGEMKVRVNNIYPVSGELYVALYKGQSSYMNPDSAFARSINAVDADSMTVSFPGIPEGTYAIAIFQDLNGNGTFDANEFGMPTEPFGFSNDSRGFFGPPDFEKASFSFNPGQVVTVSMVNQPPEKVRPAAKEDLQKGENDKDRKCRKGKKENKPVQ